MLWHCRSLPQVTSIARHLAGDSVTQELATRINGASRAAARLNVNGSNKRLQYKGQIIGLQIGDIVRLGEKTDPNGSYPNWIHCTSMRTGKTGWVAADILTLNGDDTAIVHETYTSEEMSVS